PDEGRVARHGIALEIHADPQLHADQLPRARLEARRLDPQIVSENRGCAREERSPDYPADRLQMTAGSSTSLTGGTMPASSRGSIASASARAIWASPKAISAATEPLATASSDGASEDPEL